MWEPIHYWVKIDIEIINHHTGEEVVYWCKTKSVLCLKDNHTMNRSRGNSTGHPLIAVFKMYKS